MLQRSNSIFHLGEDDDDDDDEAKKSMASDRGGAEDIDGLRILVQQQNNVVVDSGLKRCSPSKNSKELGGFLKACFLCKKELSLEKDVYMYRGNQGFCTVQCRCHQILLEEALEFEAVAARGRFRTPNGRRPATKVQDSDSRRVPTAA